MNLYDRVKIGFEAARNARRPEDVEARLSQMAQDGTLDQLFAENEFSKQVSDGSKSYLQIRKTGKEFLSFYSMLVRSVKEGDIPPYGDPSRDIYLSEFWRKEPLLAGAVYSMSAKMTALPWTVVGMKKDAQYFSNMIATAASMEGYDWGGFISASAQDFYTADRGVFWETPRNGSNVYGQLSMLGHIDALQCAMTGNTKKPVYYLSEITGQSRYFKPGEFIHFSSLPSAREANLGIGLCASSRAWRAAKLLLGLHDYDEEKLSNLPPEGVASVSGLTMDEFQDALALWKSARESNNSLTFPQVLWLIGSNPAAAVSVDMAAFSTLPESFDRSVVVEQYVNTLALVFGVDAREFWPISTSSLGTAAESEIQHLKAKGKGPGEFVSIVERKINSELPEGVEFSFDTQDINEDKQAAEIAKIWIEALLPLVTGGAAGGPKVGSDDGNSPADGEAAQPFQPAGGQTGDAGSIISKQEFLRLLADRGVLPNYLVGDKRVVVTDSGISEKMYNESDDFVSITWKEGVLTTQRLPAYTVLPWESDNSAKSPDKADYVGLNDNRPSEANRVPVAQFGASPESFEYKLNWLKQAADEVLEGERNIRGKPIPRKEAARGANVTRAAIVAELERWRNHPILSQYAPTKAEEEEFLEKTL